MIEHPKRRGEWAEAQFLSRAASLGLTVCKPWGDSARFDFIVAQASGWLRVQVKSTICVKKNGRSYACNLSPRKYHYRLGEFDFLAVYIIPEGIWYIIPAELVCCRSQNLLLTPRRSTSKYYKYLEAWHLLGANSATEHAPSSSWRTGL